MKSAYLFLLVLLLVAEPASAEDVRYLPGGHQGLAQYLEMIGKAENTIDVSFYIWDPCSVAGRIVTRALERRKKERPNLKMRLVLDANLHGAQGRSEITATLANRGVDVRFYNFTQDVRKNVRTHIKMIVVDGKEYVTGGRNIADDYYGLSSSMNWIDREAHVRGASASSAVEGFNYLWNDRLTRAERRKASPEEVKKSEDTCLKADAKMLKVEAYLLQNKSRILAEAPVVKCNNVTMAVDRADFMDGLPESAESPYFLSGERLYRKQSSAQILNLVENAQQNLRIENYSYLPTGTFLRAVDDRRDRRLDISVVTNDANDNDGTDEDGGLTHGPAAYFQRAHAKGTQAFLKVPRGRLAQADWAMTPGKPSYLIHSKVFTTDNRNAVVSSWNIDPRSLHTNLESALVVRDCPAFAAKVTGATEQTFALARRVIENPQVRECLEARHKLKKKDNLNDFLGWVVYELL